MSGKKGCEVLAARSCAYAKEQVELLKEMEEDLNAAEKEYEEKIAAAKKNRATTEEIEKLQKDMLKSMRRILKKYRRLLEKNHQKHFPEIHEEIKRGGK